jgi:predicted enzyme involved in methoxymalonyl-ACP biosynthesis
LYAGSRIFNHFLSIIEDLSKERETFKTTVKRYLLDSSFYSLEEYFKLAMIMVLFT